MELSMWTSYFIELSPEEMIDRFASMGWKKLELSTEHSQVLLERGDSTSTGKLFGEYARSKGIELEQGHLLLMGDITHPDHPDIYESWIKLYGHMGIKKAVIHPGGQHMRQKGASPDEVRKRQAAVLKRLAISAGSYGMTLCIENMPKEENSAESLLFLIKAAGGEHLAICLDTGHLNLAPQKDQEHFITLAGGYLMALHMADNDCSGDQHLIPFARGSVDWPQVMASLRKIGYKGTLNFEIPGDSINCPLPLKNDKLAYVKKVGEYLLAN